MAWYNLFNKKAPDRKPSDTPVSPIGLWGSQTKASLSYPAAVSAERALLHPITARCLNKIATSVRGVKWEVVLDDDASPAERRAVPRRTLETLNALLKSPSDNLTSDQLKYWMALTLACYGRVPFKVGMSPVTGLANGIYPLNPQYVKVKANNRGGIQSYEYGSNSGNQKTETYQTKTKAGAGESFVHELFTPTLSGTRQAQDSFSPLQSLGTPVEITAMLMQRAHDTASGHPNTKYIVSAEKTLTKAQKDALQEFTEDASAGSDESGNVLFIYNTTVKVDKLDNDLNDLHSKMPMDDMARMIAGGYGIPISLLGLGAADGAKFAGNFAESRQSLYEDTIDPSYLAPIEAGLTYAICPPGCKVLFDRDSIQALEDSRALRAEKLEKVTFLSDNEKRQLCGFNARETTESSRETQQEDEPNNT